VRLVSTIDRKADEPGLLAFCARHRLRLVTRTAKELEAVPGTFHVSKFVRETVGVDNVCERSAVCVSGGMLVYPKRAGNGVACAAAQCEIHLDFAKRRDLS
jgi:cobalt-precorrin 5A hydrolase